MSKNQHARFPLFFISQQSFSTCLKYFKYLANCVVSTEEFLRNTIQSFTSYNDKNTLIKKQNTFEGNENFVFRLRKNYPNDKIPTRETKIL